MLGWLFPQTLTNCAHPIENAKAHTPGHTRARDGWLGRRGAGGVVRAYSCVSSMRIRSDVTVLRSPLRTRCLDDSEFIAGFMRTKTRCLGTNNAVSSVAATESVPPRMRACACQCVLGDARCVCVTYTSRTGTCPPDAHAHTATHMCTRRPPLAVGHRQPPYRTASRSYRAHPCART